MCYDYNIVLGVVTSSTLLPFCLIKSTTIEKPLKFDSLLRLFSSGHYCFSLSEFPLFSTIENNILLSKETEILKCVGEKPTATQYMG